MKQTSSQLFKFINDLVQFSPRQGKNEQKAANYIIKLVNHYKLPITLQKFSTTIPTYPVATLMADNTRVACKGTGLKSGSFEHNDHIISSFFNFENDVSIPANINFNPRCANAISTPMLYQEPALAVNKKDLPVLLTAHKIRGKITVKPYTFTSCNILVGNTQNPSSVVLTHYDGLDGGAVDNASGVAVLLDIAISYPELFKKSLFVFAGNEELSYDMPTYWGNGYRVFQKANPHILNQARTIIGIDSVGYAKPIVNTSTERLKNAFPLTNIDAITDKFTHICCPFEGMMPFYHSNADTIEIVNHRYLGMAGELVRSHL